MSARVGRLWLDPSPVATPVVRVPVAKAAQLCGQSLDWIEVVKN